MSKAERAAPAARRAYTVESLAKGLRILSLFSERRSIAGPVRDNAGRVIAAVNIAVPAVLFSVDDLHARLRDPLLAACAQISRRMGASE